MYDSELVVEILRQIYQAAQTILERFQPVKTVSDFTESPAGMEKLDSLCMLLIASIKKSGQNHKQVILAAVSTG